MAGKATKLPVEPGSVALVCDGLLECRSTLRAQHSHLPLEIKKENLSEQFSAGSLLWCLHHSLPSPAQTGLRFSFSPSVGSLWGHPDGPRSHLQ